MMFHQILTGVLPLIGDDQIFDIQAPEFPVRVVISNIFWYLKQKLDFLISFVSFKYKLRSNYLFLIHNNLSNIKLLLIQYKIHNFQH
jgi:hypothetical protein